jgi:hypothetical protein
VVFGGVAGRSQYKVTVISIAGVAKSYEIERRMSLDSEVRMGTELEVKTAR